MPQVIGVRFRSSPRVYYFAPQEGEEYEKDSSVVVDTQRGLELATVVMPLTDVEEEKIVAPLKQVVRKATEAELADLYISPEKKCEILAVAKEKVAARGLNMKIVDCEYTFDRSKLALYFTAEQRVDFRELVRDLASAFKMRIDLRQIGPRDECKLIGTLGACGLPCCCGRFESDSEHVSIKMAKNQGLALTPGKINGMCNRLLCCLSYENATYEEVLKRAPKHNAPVTLPDGRTGSVMSVEPLGERVRVRVGDMESYEIVEVALDDLLPAGAEAVKQQNKQGGKQKGFVKPPRREDKRPQERPVGIAPDEGYEQVGEQPRASQRPEKKDRPQKGENRRKGDRRERFDKKPRREGQPENSSFDSPVPEPPPDRRDRFNKKPQREGQPENSSFDSPVPEPPPERGKGFRNKRNKFRHGKPHPPEGGQGGGAAQ